MNSTKILLSQLGLDWSSHKASLGWLDCMIRRPRDFEAAKGATAPTRLAIALVVLGIHGSAYVLALSIFVSYLSLIATGSGAYEAFFQAFGSWIPMAAGFYWGTFGGSALHVWASQKGWLLKRSIMIVPPVLLLVGSLGPERLADSGVGFIFGLFAGLTLVPLLDLGIAFGPVLGMAMGIGFGIAGSTLGMMAVVIPIALATSTVPVGLLGVIYGILLGFAFGISFGLDHGTGRAMAVGTGFGALYSLVLLRGFYLPLHLAAFLRISPGVNPYKRHPLLTDQCIHLSLPYLDRLLIALHTYSAKSADFEIDRLIDTYPSQRNAALRAKTIITIRRAANLSDLTQIDAMLNLLPSGKKGFLAETEAARRLAREVTAAARRLNEAPRGYLRAPYAEILIDKTEIFRHEIAGFRAPLSTELRRAAEQWQEVARGRFAEAQRLSPGAAFLPVFRAGDAIEREFDAYVPRRGLLVDLEEQIHLASASAGVVLVGRRRTGKSTLLHNLAAQVRSTADVAVISMQSPRAFTSISSLQRLLYEKLAGTLPVAELPTTGADLGTLETLLSGADAMLAQQQRKLVLAIDEYENLDAKIAAGVFPEDLLALLRDSMRSHRRIYWIFAGGRSVEELAGARWTSYFVGTRLLEMPLFDPGETRELLTEPMKASSLFKDDKKRPRFAAEFWGEDGIARLHREAGGWPHLVQLLAQNAVQLVNQEGRRQLDEKLFDKVCAKAVAEGSVVFTELLEKESRLPGEWEYLSAFREADEQEASADPAILRSLRRRWMIEDASPGRCRLRVPLMRRWLRERG